MEPSITDWIQAIAESVAAFGIVLVLIQLMLTAKQIKLAREQNEEICRQNNATILWNRMQAAFAFFPEELFMKREIELIEQMRLMDIELVPRFVGTLSDGEAQRIFDHPDCARALRYYLNVLEDYCLAVNMGLVDDDLAYAQMRGAIIARATFFWPLIDLVRKKSDDEDIFCELEITSKRWKEKDEQTREMRRKVIEEAKSIAESIISDAVRDVKSNHLRNVYPPKSN
ncbi:MAG: DUF4760 domain-containing protein [Lysobacter sp.]|nr:MAG: DUF4760 domain-containing protein [Lysobacter sp.]